MLRANICAMAVILITASRVRFTAWLKQIRPHIFQHIEPPHGASRFYTIKQALHPFGHIHIIFRHWTMHGTERATYFLVQGPAGRKTHHSRGQNMLLAALFMQTKVFLHQTCRNAQRIARQRHAHPIRALYHIFLNAIGRAAAQLR